MLLPLFLPEITHTHTRIICIYRERQREYELDESSDGKTGFPLYMKGILIYSWCFYVTHSDNKLSELDISCKNSLVIL